MTARPSPWRLYHAYFRGAYRALLLSLPLSIGQALTILPIAGMVRHAFDTVLPAGDVTGLGYVGAGILALYAANVGLTLWGRHVILTAAKRSVADLRNDLLRRCYAHVPPGERGPDTGWLHNAIVQDTERVDTMTFAVAAVLAPQLLIGAALCVVLVTLNPTLFALSLAVVPVLLVLRRYLASRARAETAAFHRTFERFSSGVTFLLRSRELARIQGAEQAELERQALCVEQLRSTSQRMAWLFAAQTSVHNAALAAAGVLVLIVGGQSVAAGTLTLGELLAFSVATALLITHIGASLAAAPQVVVGIEALRSLVQVWHVPDAPPYTGRRRLPFRGLIRAEDVWFQYGDRPLLRGIDLTLQPQAITALVGPNGAGKSTLLHLMLGLHRPQRGAFYADGQPYDDLDLVHLRRSMGVVPQDPLIIPGTILDNITYGTPDVTREEAIRAAEAATADAFVAQLPAGYDTPVGEDGALLSGGQRQRLAIARALVRQPALLILDEPGNHLDRPTVHLLMARLRALNPRPTTLIITHDDAIVSRSDAVYRLEDGRIGAVPVAVAGATRGA